MIKSSLTAIGLLIAFSSLFAQAPEVFNYQAVARDASGDAVTNASIGVQFQLHQTTAGGTIVYAEIHAPTTNEHGLFSVAIGNGIPTSGTFNTIDWKSGPYFLEVGLDPAGGSSYTSMGTQQLMSVPYALHANSVDLGGDDDWVASGDTLHSDGKRVGIGRTDPLTPLHIENTGLGITHTSEDSLIAIGTYVSPNSGAYLQTHTDHDLNFATNNGLAQLTLTTDGKLGIGNTDPLERFHIGNFSPPGTDNYMMITTIGGGVHRAGIKLHHFPWNSGFSIESDDRTANRGLNFIEQTVSDPVGETRLFIQRTTGHIGVSTSSPAGLLHLAAPAGVDLPTLLFEGGSEDISTLTGQALQFGHWDGSAFTERMRISSDGSVEIDHSIKAADNDGIKFRTDDDEARMIINDNGRIKIGTDAGFFQGELHVYSADTDPILFTEGSGLSLASSIFRDLTFGHHWLGSSDQQMTLDVAGNLGIGAVEPKNRLHVASTIAGPWDNSDAYTARIDFPIGGNGLIIRADQTNINQDVSFVTFGTALSGAGTSSFWKAGRIRGFDYNDPNDWSPPGFTDLNDAAASICWFNTMIGGIPPTDLVGLGLLASWNNLVGACRNQGVIYESSFGDYAEYLEKENPNEDLYVSDIVGVRNGKISRNTDGAEQFMSVSLAPIVLGNMPQDEDLDRYEKVGFMGQVPIKVRGIVRSGDYIMPSGMNDGEGIAIAPEDLELKHIGKIVGRSWTDSDHEGLNIINAVIGVKSYEIVEVLKKELERTERLEITVHELKAQNIELRDLIEANSALLKNLEGVVNAQTKK